VLVYEWDGANPAKQSTARSLVRRLGTSGAFSSQVAQEFASVMSGRFGMKAQDVAQLLRTYHVFKFVPVEMHLVELALLTAEASRISFWDALIVEAARDARCEVLHTEDLNHGQVIRGVRVSNPFRTTAA
jgi:predicted nucleic acid-binding protein